MEMMKKCGALVCTLAMLVSMLAVCSFSTSAYTGGGQSGTYGIKSEGCDLSVHNVSVSNGNDYSKVDFAKMKADGCDFAILRIGYEASSSRKNTLDSAFVEYYNRARAAGVQLGVYFYSLAYSRAAAVEDAQWVIDTINQYGMYFEYPIYYDVEDPGSDTDSTRPGHESLSSSAMTELCLGWAETMEAAGFFPGMYAGRSVIQKLQSSYTSKYDVWYARVKSATANSAQYTPGDGTYFDNIGYVYNYCGMWQYAWYDYNYDGVTKNMLDVDVTYKDYPSIIVSQGLNNNAVGHKITFETNGGSAVGAINVIDGNAASAPTAPTKYGMSFGGWYCNPELTDPYNWSTPVSYDFTLYAKWNEGDWPALKDLSLMPVDGKLQLESYNEAGDKLWPYWSSDYNCVTMYSGVDGWAWPSATMTFESAIDGNNEGYIYFKKDGSAYFNAVINYLDKNGDVQGVSLSQLAGRGTDDFEPGYVEMLVDLAAYVRAQGQTAPSGNIKIVSCRYFVVGERDDYVTLYDMRATPSFAISDPYLSGYSASVPITQSGVSGSYVYNDGVLTMNSNSESYSLTFAVEKEFNPKVFKYLKMDLSSTVPFNVTMNVDCATGAADMQFRTEYFDVFGCETAPDALAAGDWKVHMDSAGYFTWNGGLIDNSKLHTVTITMYGSGKLTLSALQLTSLVDMNYIKDGAYLTGSLSQDAEDIKSLTSDVYRVSEKYVTRVWIGTTVSEMRDSFNEDKAIIAVFNADGSQAADADLMKTGMTVAIVKDGEIVRSYTVAVVGDTKGTGIMTTANARDLLVAVVNGEEISELTQLAADYDGDDSFNTTDIRKMLYDMVN